MGFHEKPVPYVGHVNIKVRDLQRSVDFYQEVLGFGILEQTGSEARLTADGKTSFLSLVQPEQALPKQPGTTGLYHFAILLPSAGDLADMVVHLAGKGVPFASADHLVSEALYLNDPDGNGIEIYRDRPPEEWAWNGSEVNMDTLPLNFNRLLKRASKGKKWEKMPRKTVIGHIHLHVSDLADAETFYTKGLGMDVVLRYGSRALFLSYGKYHHHVGVNTWNGTGAPRPPERSAGLESFTLLFHEESVRSRAIQNLRQIGAPVSKENGRVFTVDPSGNKIELAV